MSCYCNKVTVMFFGWNFQHVMLYFIKSKTNQKALQKSQWPSLLKDHLSLLLLIIILQISSASRWDRLIELELPIFYPLLSHTHTPTERKRDRDRDRIKKQWFIRHWRSINKREWILPSPPGWKRNEVIALGYCPDIVSRPKNNDK